MNVEKKAIIIGAGPAGLTAAYELLRKTNIKPIVYEMNGEVGGLAKTINFKGNRIDIGGHRFFSKSDRVMNWWLHILPLQKTTGGEYIITYQGKKRNVYASENGPDPQVEDRVMLLRERKSRIYFMRRFFDYPLALNINTIKNLGMQRMLRIGASYAGSVLFPIRKEENLEQFFINRFGEELYRTFFKSYTEKVWGVPCSRINSAWGRQRIKGLSIGKAILHVFKKSKETSLIEQFLYPKYGPGQMWQEVAKKIQQMGGEIYLRHKLVSLTPHGQEIEKITVQNVETATETEVAGNYFFSSIPIKELFGSFNQKIPRDIARVANGLLYRDFVTVGLLVTQLKIGEVTDNWIYIQEPDVRLGRLQIFNNWSPYMVRDPKKIWLGLEYFCNENDEMWRKSDKDFINFAIEELSKIAIINKNDVENAILIRVPKAYPAYFGTYGNFGMIRNFANTFENLFLIGRNGMHRYNNQDHSMLTAMQAVENIIRGEKNKDKIWQINTEEDYHERT